MKFGHARTATPVKARAIRQPVGSPLNERQIHDDVGDIGL